MKIIRHSQKVLIYSLPLLLHLQYLSCQPPMKSDGELRTIADGHNNTDLLIDEMQKAIGAVDTTQVVRFTHRSKNETIAHLIAMQEQRMTYDTRWLFVNSERRKKEDNKKEIRRDFISIVRTAEAYHSSFTPEAKDIRDLPQNPIAIHATTVIDILQSAFGSVRNKNLEFLSGTSTSKTITQITHDLGEKHKFFQRIEDTCCCASSGDRDLVTQYKIFLRTRMIPYLYFAQLQVYKQTSPPPFHIPPTAPFDEKEPGTIIS